MMAAIFMVPTFAFAYTVNGVVDFTYTSNQIKVGDNTSSNHTFTEHYEVNTAGFIYDPRFLRLNAGIGYNRTHSSNASDYNSLNYNVNAAFFPGRMFSWDLYAMQSTMTVQSNATLSGYDVDTTSYGGSLKLSLSKIRPRPGNNNVNNSGNNNNNNSNNNSNNNQEGRRRWSSLSYPDIYLSRTHQESESKNLQSPLHETRDDTSAIIYYRINSTLDLHMSGTAEEFKNLRNSSSYDNKTADLQATAWVLPNAELKINGSMNQRTVTDIAGFANTASRTSKFGAHLDFKERNRISYNFGYDYANIRSAGAEYTTQVGAGYIRYALLPELSLYGGLNYSETEFVQEATLLVPYNTSTMTSGGLNAGANYKKVYAPAFLDPFVLTSNYDFSTGFTKLSTLEEGDLGGGIYYQNIVDLGLRSTGWKYETMSFDSNYLSRRDASPVNNDSMSRAFRFQVNTKRLSRTDINVILSYRSQKTSVGSDAGSFSPISSALNNTTRSVDYTASIDHALTPSVNLSAGATQGKISSNSGYTLSTLTSTTDTKLMQLYFQALFNYNITRDLHVRASLREEERRADYAADITSYQASIGLNHRIRALMLSADWRWREDITDHMPRIYQQSLMLKVSRPF